MKNLYLLLFLSILFSSANAQNWIPIQENERHHFQRSDATSISNTIYTDSVTTNGQEIIYHLNRVMEECDTCTASYVQPFLFNEGQFLLKRMVQQADGGYRFEGGGSFVLYPHLSLGSSWLFDTLMNIEATLTNPSTATVLGEQDSVKYITLSSGELIVCSKNHGLLSFPDFSNSSNYNLVGLELAELGEQIPNHWDFYDFNVGDVFQYYSRESLNPGKPHYIEATEKLTVLEKAILPQGYQYTMRRLGIEGRYDGWYWQTPFEDTIQVDYFYKEADFFNQYPGEQGAVVQEPELKCYDEPGEPRARGKVTYSIDPVDQLRTKTLGSIDEYSSLFCPDYENPDWGARNVVDQYHETFKEGLGLVDFGFFIFEVWGTKTLEGYIKDGDTVGVITNDVVLDTEDPFAPSLTFQLAPNPVQDELVMQFQTPLPDEGQIIVWNMNAQALLRQVVAPGKSTFNVNVSHLPQGTYSIQLIVEGHAGVKRFVKSQ